MLGGDQVGYLPAMHLNGFQPSLVSEGYISLILGMRSEEARVISGGLLSSSMVRACSCVPPTIRVLYVPILSTCFCPCDPPIIAAPSRFTTCRPLLCASFPSSCRWVRVLGMIYSPANNTDSKDASPSRSSDRHISMFWPRTYEKGNSWSGPQRAWIPMSNTAVGIQDTIYIRSEEKCLAWIQCKAKKHLLLSGHFIKHQRA